MDLQATPHSRETNVIVLEIDYQAAKRKLAAQSEYLFALEIARGKARAAGFVSDAGDLTKMIDGASWHDTDSQDIVERYDQQTAARRERQLMLSPRPYAVGAL